MAEMTGRERILAAIRHEEPDRVPVSPRVGVWLIAEFGDASLATQLERLPDVDPMHIVPDGTPDLVEETVRDAMEVAKPGGGFIIGSSDSFREGTQGENIEAYFAACRHYGRY